MKNLSSFKKADFESVLSNNTLMILANPRSGSTWLFDAIRCHPAVDMLTRGDIYRDLNLSGRRYPRDLVPNDRDQINVEVRPDTEKWAAVPLFSVPEAEYNIPPEILQKNYAIEKIHPHFYDFKIDSFISKIIEYAGKGGNLKMIYLVRDPKASLVSFFNYQKRNPDWNSSKAPEDVFKHMNLIYQNILEVAKLWEGLIIDYGKLVEDFDNSLSRVFEFLWPGTGLLDADRNQLIERIKAETAWERRKSKKPFLGKKIGLIAGDNSDYGQLFELYADELDQCYSYYESLLLLNDR